MLVAGGQLEPAVHNADREDGVRKGDDLPGGRWFTYWKSEELIDVVERGGFDVLAVAEDGFARRVRAGRR